MTFEQALSLAHVLLNRRERTEQELREQLLRRDAPQEVIEAVIRELTDQRYLDDARYASMFVQDKRDLDQWGSNRIRRALVQRGIPRKLADLALEADAETGELGRALELLSRRFPSPLATARERERALGLLIRRGYEYELAVDALAAHRRAAAG